jgi:hypothetical protein
MSTHSSWDSSWAANVFNWSDFLVYCIISGCTGLLIGLILPIGKIFYDFEPGQSGLITSLTGIMLGVGLYFSRFHRSATKEDENTVAQPPISRGDTEGMSAEAWVLVGLFCVVVVTMIGFAIKGLPTPRGTPGSAFPPTINGQ